MRTRIAVVAMESRIHFSIKTVTVLLIYQIVFSKCDSKTKIDNHLVKSYIDRFQRHERQAPMVYLEATHVYVPPTRTEQVISKSKNNGEVGPGRDTSTAKVVNVVSGNADKGVAHLEIPNPNGYEHVQVSKEQVSVSSNSFTTTNGAGADYGHVQNAPNAQPGVGIDAVVPVGNPSLVPNFHSENSYNVGSTTGHQNSPGGFNQPQSVPAVITTNGFVSNPKDIQNHSTQPSGEPSIVIANSKNNPTQNSYSYVHSSSTSSFSSYSKVWHQNNNVVKETPGSEVVSTSGFDQSQQTQNLQLSTGSGNGASYAQSPASNVRPQPSDTHGSTEPPVKGNNNYVLYTNTNGGHEQGYSATPQTIKNGHVPADTQKLIEQIVGQINQKPSVNAQNLENHSWTNANTRPQDTVVIVQSYSNNGVPVPASPDRNVPTQVSTSNYGSGQPPSNNYPPSAEQQPINNHSPGTGQPPFNNYPPGTEQQTVNNHSPGTGQQFVNNLPSGTGQLMFNSYSPGAGQQTVNNHSPGAGQQFVNNQPPFKKYPPGAGQQTVNNYSPSTGQQFVNNQSPFNNYPPGAVQQPGNNHPPGAVQESVNNHPVATGQLPFNSYPPRAGQQPGNNHPPGTAHQPTSPCVPPYIIHSDSTNSNNAGDQHSNLPSQSVLEIQVDENYGIYGKPGLNAFSSFAPGNEHFRPPPLPAQRNNNNNYICN